MCFPDPPPHVGGYARIIAAPVEFADAGFEAVEEFAFGGGEGAVEDGEVIHVTDLGGAEDEEDFGGVPAEGEVPVFDGYLDLEETHEEVENH